MRQGLLLSIFQKSILNSIKQDESLIALRWNNFQNYVAKIDAIRGFKEEVYQDGFFKDVFESCLGYTLKTTNPSDYNLEREKKNETDGKKADGVVYVNGEIIGGVFQNRALMNRLYRRFGEGAFYAQQQTPINDGSIALGQLYYELNNS